MNHSNISLERSYLIKNRSLVQRLFGNKARLGARQRAFGLILWTMSRCGTSTGTFVYYQIKGITGAAKGDVDCMLDSLVRCGLAVQADKSLEEFTVQLVEDYDD